MTATIHHAETLPAAAGQAIPTTPPRPSPAALDHDLLRAHSGSDAAVLQAIWTASQDADDRTFRPRSGWWSLAAWAQASQLLVIDGLAVGVAAIAPAAETGVVEARLALLPAYRRLETARQLVRIALNLAQVEGATAIRLYLPAMATWAQEAVIFYDFHPIRTTDIMLRPAAAPSIASPPVSGIHIRPLREGEEATVLAALNRAWDGTWNFRPITLEAFEADLDGQRDGFLVAVAMEATLQIAGTIHALFDATHQNPDGSPYAWLSNLTTDPDWRGRGLGRALLQAGVAHLGRRGAGSIALGVDTGNPAPLHLYRAAGFQTISQLEVWERTITL